MTSSPAVPPPDDKDWTWVLSRPCPECGFDATAMDRTEIASFVRRVVSAFDAALAQPAARERPSPEVWSVLEYGCHLRDVCVLFDQRLTLMLDSDDPLFSNWDQGETALESRYWEREPAVVAREFASAGEKIADAFAGVADDQWGRPGRRSNGSVFTIDTFGRYFVHDLVHHAHDIGASIG
jgi:hypothetical protein